MEEVKCDYCGNFNCICILCDGCGSKDEFCGCHPCTCGSYTCNVEYSAEHDIYYKSIGDRGEIVCENCHEKYCDC